MFRFALDHLAAWKERPHRKPLIIRGARQVGKSHLVRLFAEAAFDHLVELNFERDPELASLFAGNRPRETARLLELQFGMPLEAGRTLIFLDEVQAAAATILPALRYFYEELPALHVVAAGSLLEPVLAQHSFPMPVGRVEYLHLGPMQFEEFLLAAGEDGLARYLAEIEPRSSIPVALHGRLLGMLRRFVAVGGMPHAVRVYLETGSLRDTDAAKQSILSTYQDDFGKYGARVPHERLVKVYRKLPQLVGRRFKYVHVDREERAKDIATALHLLALARVAHCVRHSSSNGVPLGAEANDRKLKLLFLDVGLMLRALGMGLLDLERAGDLLGVGAGSVCEQLVGQHLLFGGEPYEEPDLYFWAREKRNSAAEVDYVLPVGPAVVPVEVKAGKTGTLKSLHLFLQEKGRTLGLRLNTDPPSLLATEAPGRDGRRHGYQLLSLPLYLVGQARRLLAGLA